MNLVIKSDFAPIEKKYWHDPKFEARNHWGKIVEAISNWFCYSNGMRKSSDLYLVFADRTLHFAGEELRYLAPNFRSIMSLVFHGYNQQTRSKKRVIGIKKLNELPIRQLHKPWINLTSGEVELEKISNIPDVTGVTLFINFDGIEFDQSISLPFKEISQSIIWLLFSSDKKPEGEIHV